MNYGYIQDSANVEIPDEVITKKVEEVISKPDSIVATKKDLEDLKENIIVNTDFGVF